MIEGLVTYERLVPGEAIGSVTLDVTPEDIADYREAVGGLDPEPPLSPGLAIAMMMRAYMRLMPRRPAGTIHASQKLSLGIPLAPSDRVTMVLRCAEKEQRKGRGWVRFETELRNQAGALVLGGEQWVVWAK